MKNVLVFPCGSEIGLEIQRALAGSKHFRLIGASSSDDHGRYVYKNYIGGLPFVDAPEFMPALQTIIKQHAIDFVIPAHDSVVLLLAEQQQNISATVLVPSAQTCRICRSKKATYDHLAAHLPVPQIYQPDEQLPLPVFLKPDVGQGSKGVYKVDKQHEIAGLLAKDPSLLILEYLPGREYTVDCFTDRHGRLLFAQGRERARIYSGISVNSRPVADPRFAALAEVINRELAMQGVWFFQVKERADGELVLMEVAPRVAGTMALFRACGVNFIELSLFDRDQKDVGVIYNPFSIEIDRALSANFRIDMDYQSVYVDFDDTLIIADAVNTDMVKYLYQCRNQGKKIILLSRHRADISQTLARFAISPQLFDDIIIITNGDSKADYITAEKAIFIDDSYAERKSVFDRLAIPVFSVDALEALLQPALQ